MPDYSNHTPTSRTEMILRNMVDGTEITLDPQSAVEYLLIQLNDKIGPGGGSLKPAGSKTFENLGVPSEEELGNIYNITDDFISNQYFIDGSGKSYKAGTNVYCIVQKDPLTEEDAYWWDIFGASIDLSEYLTKNEAEETYLGISQAGVPNGVATLGNDGKVIELPINLLTSSQLGIAGGIASLGSDGKVPSNQLPASMPASDVYEWAKAATKPDYTANEVGALSASDGQTIALQVAQLSASKLSISQVGVPNGVASLGSDGKVIELPINLLTSSQLGIAGGIATLGNDGKVPTEQLPSISGGDTVPGFKPIDFGAFYQGSYIWTDGTDIYYSKAGTQKVFDKTTKTWSNKTWYGRTSFEGNKIWTDGTDYYYSAGGGLQFKLNKETSTWESITFSTFNSASGEYVWWDGTNAQYNNSTNKYTYNKAIQDWEVQASPAAPFNFNGSAVWTDGTDIYLSYQNSHYVLDKVNMAWVSKTWTGCTNFTGDAIWTDGVNMYISSVVSGTPVQYILDKENSNWVPFKWYGPMINLYGYNIWTDGTDIYYDNGTSFSGTLYEFNPFELMGVANGIAELNNDGRIQSSQTNYVSAGQKANTTLGSRATAEGADTTASGGNSHAEGASTKATNTNAHAEGNLSTASGSSSHAEGMQTTASGSNSHAEGSYTDTNNFNSSHAEGYYTKNGAPYQHVEGSYNKGESYTYHEVGNGINTLSRSNVFEITFGDEVVTYGKNYVVSEKTNIANVADCGTIQSIAIAVSDAGVVTVTYSNGTETTYNMAEGHTGVFAWNSKTSNRRVYIKKGENHTFTFATTRPSLIIDSVKMTVIDDEVTDSHGNKLSDMLPVTTKYAESDNVGGGAKYVKRTNKDSDANTTFYPWLTTGTTSIDNASGYVSSDVRFAEAAGTENNVGVSHLKLGNSTGSGTAGNKEGKITLYAEGASAASILKSGATSTRTNNLPDKSGTLATIEDIPSITTTTTDPGAGSALTTGNIVFVYDA